MFFIQLQANVLDLSFCKVLFYLMIPQENHQQICPPKGIQTVGSIGFLTSLGREFWMVTVQTHGKLLRDRCRNKLGETPNFPTKKIWCFAVISKRCLFFFALQTKLNRGVKICLCISLKVICTPLKTNGTLEKTSN